MRLVTSDDSKIQSYDAYCIHNAVRLHFSSGKYDYFKYNGKTKVMSSGDFSRSKNRFDYLRVVRKHPTALEVQSLCACNYAVDPKWFITKHRDTESQDRFMKWKRFNEMPEHFFKLNMDASQRYLLELYDYQDVKPDFLWNPHNGNLPVLFQRWVSGEVQVETLCVLNQIMNLFTHWNTVLEFDPIWEELRNTVPKYMPFVMRNIPDTQPYTDIVRKNVTDLKNYP